MCTIAFLVGVAEAPLVVAANRDELYARPTRPPERWVSGVVGGVDALSGGTWLAVNSRGSFAAVTNQRALDPPPPGLRSRGLAVAELAAADDPDAFVAALDPRRYASMNLVWGDANAVRICYSRVTGDKDIETLPRGIHVLCNDRLGAPGFPRCERFALACEHALGKPWPMFLAALGDALADHTKVDPPPSHLPPALARELTATCIHSESYGTRSATIIALEPGRVREYLHADGRPCETRFASVKALLDA
jgi:uncharacterized protein with NRDE domain